MPTPSSGSAETTVDRPERLSASGATTGPGLVGSSAARIWLRCRCDGLHRIELWSSGAWSAQADFDPAPRPELDGATSVAYPHDFAGAPALPPNSTIHYRIADRQGELGRGRFHTAPESGRIGEPFSIAFLSCHQPLESSGEVHAVSARALERLPGVLEAFGVQRVLALGDQMYTDRPSGRSLFDDDYLRTVHAAASSIFECTASEVSALLNRRYREALAFGGFSRVLSNWSTTMIFDDHEFVDNFGSDPEHRQPRWSAIREGALRAAFSYEGLRQHPPCATLPPSLHFCWEYGPVAVFVMDLRSERSCDEERLRFFGDRQLQELASYLHEQRHRPVVVIGLSIPLAFAPSAWVEAGIELTGEGSDAAERWWNPKAARERRAFVELVRGHRRRHPEQLVLLASGDVHAGMMSRIDFDDCHVYQLISSPVSNHQSFFSRAAAELIPTLGAQQNEGASWKLLLHQGEGRGSNPYAGLNVGILTITPEPNGVRAVARIVGLSEDEGPRVVFESAALAGSRPVRQATRDGR